MARQPEQSNLGEQVIDEQASDHQVQNRVFDLKAFQKAGGECHESHLADRRITEQPLRPSLTQTDQV